MPSFASVIDMLTNKIVNLRDPTNPQDASTKAYVDTQIATVVAGGIPVATMTMYAGTTAPPGWLLCDGSSQLIATYSALSAAIRASFGGVDGTHFNLPDLRNRFPQGAATANPLATAGGIAVTDLLNHTHNTPLHVHMYDVSGSGTGGTANAVIQRGSGAVAATISTAINNSGGGATGNPLQTSVGTGENRPPYLTVNYLIKT